MSSLIISILSTEMRLTEYRLRMNLLNAMLSQH